MQKTNHKEKPIKTNISALTDFSKLTKPNSKKWSFLHAPKPKTYKPFHSQKHSI